MPRDEGNRGENPADEGMREKFPQRLRGRPAKKRTEDGAYERLGKAVKQRKSGSAEEEERRNYQHQEDVLDHVDGEGCIVKGGKRRTDGDPEQEHGG